MKYCSMSFRVRELLRDEERKRWNEWVDSMPDFLNDQFYSEYRIADLKEWLKRMPVRKYA